MKLYVIGVGPGDPELLTIKAKRILEVSDTIFCPKGGKESIALSVVKKVVDTKDKKLVYLDFPMVKTKDEKERENLKQIWENLAKRILLEMTNVSSFITLGDPSLYSTFFYLYDYLKDKIAIEFIPGVSSINASACRVPTSLGIANEKIALLPVNYEVDLKEIAEKFDTIVLLKPNKLFKEIKDFFANRNFESYYIKRATTEEEAIYKNLNDVPEEDLEYFSIVIAKKEKIAR